MAEWSSPETADDVLAYLREHVNDNDEVTVSFRTLGAELNISRGTARNALRRLVDFDQIELARLGTGHRYPSRYRVLETANVVTAPAA